MNSRIISVKARTKAKERKLSIGADGVFVVSTPAAPERNKANLDIIALLAEHFGVARSQVEIIAGGTSRQKKIRIIS